MLIYFVRYLWRSQNKYKNQMLNCKKQLKFELVDDEIDMIALFYFDFSAALQSIRIEIHYIIINLNRSFYIHLF